MAELILSLNDIVVLVSKLMQCEAGLGRYGNERNDLG